jgi:hypothetical protein
MALTQRTQLEIAFRRALGKVYTNPNIGIGSEPISTAPQVATSTIFAGTIPTIISASSDSTVLYTSQSLDNSSVVLARFELVDINISEFLASNNTLSNTTIDQTADPDVTAATSIKHAKALKLSGSFNESITTAGGTNFYRISDITSNTVPFSSSYHLSGSVGRLQLVPPVFGSNYAATVRSNTAGNPIIPDNSSINWVLDYYSGILFIQDAPADVASAQGINVNDVTPKFVDAYVYVGKFADEAIAEGGSGGGGTGTAVGWTKSGTVLFTSESYSQVQITGSLLVSGSNINLNVLGPITGSSILASSGFVGDGSQLTGIRKLSNGSTAIEALSDKLFASSSLVVSGSGIAFAVSGAIETRYATFTSSLLPTDNQQQNLGSNSKQWNNAWIKSGSFTDISVTTISGNTATFNTVNVTTLNQTTTTNLNISASFVTLSSGSNSLQASNGLLVQKSTSGTGVADGLIYAVPENTGIYGATNRWAFSSSIAMGTAQTSQARNILPFMQIQTNAFTGTESPVLGKGDFLMVSGSGGTTDGLYIYF